MVWEYTSYCRLSRWQLSPHERTTTDNKILHLKPSRSRRMKLLLAAALALLGGRAASECPESHEEVPTLHDDSTFNCMTYWQGSGDPSQLNSCVDCFGTSWPENGLTRPDGYDYTAEPGSYHSVGSFLVKPGCTGMPKTLVLSIIISEQLAVWCCNISTAKERVKHKTSTLNSHWRECAIMLHSQNLYQSISNSHWRSRDS